LNPGPADNRFRLSAHCANEPQRQAVEVELNKKHDDNDADDERLVAFSLEQFFPNFENEFPIMTSIPVTIYILSRPSTTGYW